MRSSVLVVSIALALTLSACTTGTPETQAPPTAEATPAPAPTAAVTFAPVVVPTDCATLVDAATAATTFGETPLNDPALGYPEALGVVAPTAPAAGATAAEAVDAATQLRCIWRYPQADVTYLQAQIGSVAADLSGDYLASLQLDGHACEATLDGTRCAITGIDPQYQTDTAHTVFVRDDIVIRIDQANFATDNLLGSIVARIWTA